MVSKLCLSYRAIDYEINLKRMMFARPFSFMIYFENMLRADLREN
jgi:hypothetical protein